jgi:hypothetical protein
MRTWGIRRQPQSASVVTAEASGQSAGYNFAMARSASSATTREVAREAWSEYLDAVSLELLNAPVSIEVIAAPGPPVVEAERLALQALAYDRRDDVFEVAAARGGPHPPSVLRHMVDHPARIEVDSDTMLAPMTIAVEGRDGVRTVISIERDAEFTG